MGVSEKDFCLEFMLTIDKMQNISTLMYKKFERIQSYSSFHTVCIV